MSEQICEKPYDFTLDFLSPNKEGVRSNAMGPTLAQRGKPIWAFLPIVRLEVETYKNCQFALAYWNCRVVPDWLCLGDHAQA